MSSELPRRLKWQRRYDDHADRIGSFIANAACTAFILGLVAAAIFGTPLGWAKWLIAPFVIGSLLRERRHPEERF